LTTIQSISVATAPITSSSSSFGASGIFIGSVATALTARNNIVNIKGVSSSAASNIAALRRVSGTAGTKPSNFTLSNNIWNVNKTSGTENYIYAEGTATTFTNAYHIGGGSSGTNDATTFNSACGAYKSWMGDVAAFTEDSLVAGGVAGTWVPNSASLAQNSAVTLAGITIDNSGATRNATTPDRGALEFAGTAGQDLVPPSISYTNVPNLNCSNAPTISATITDATGVNTTTFKPRLYYKFSGNVNDSVTNTSAGNGWKWIETSSTSNPYTFTFDFSKLNVAVAVDSVIQYFIVAQDVASVPNVANNIVSFNTGFCPSSVVLRQAGFPVSGVKSFKILSPPTVFMTAKPNPVCYLNNDTLNIAIGSYTDVTIGNGSGSLVSTFGNPYRTGAGTTTHRLQYLVAKSELDAAGILAGNINSLSMTTSSTMTGSITNYEIKLAHTAATNMTTTFLTPTFTTQFTAATLTVVAPGVNLHSFSSPFTWNGNDNIVIEICYSTVTGTTATTVANPTSPHITTPTIHATGGGCTAATGSTSVLRPQFIFNALSGSPMSSITWRDTSNNVLSTSNPYIAQPSFSGNTSNTQKFRVTAIDPSGCSFNDSIIVNKNTTLPSISAKSLSNTFPCFGDSITVSSTVLNGCPPYTYNFTIATSLGGSKSPLLLSSTNKFFPTIDKGYVYLLITDNNNQKDSTLIDSFELPAAPIADHDTICGTGQATLNALGVTDALWYNKSNLEVPIQTTGTSFITPIISATDTFYVSNKISFTSAQGGRLTNPTGGSALGGVPRGVIFDLSQAMKMDSIGLLCGGNAGTATIQLYNSTGTAAISTPIVVNIAASGTSPNLQMFKVNWPSLAIGTYRIFVTGVTGTTPLWYEFTGVTGYPYAISGTSGSVGNITASATALTGAASTTTYYYFYKLVFGEKCESRKVPVYAVSGSAPALTMSGAGPLQICNTTTNTT
jgi:hypothetical protein